MGHSIQGLLASDEWLRRGTKRLSNVHVIPLDQGLSFLPVTDELFEAISANGLHGSPYAQFWKLSTGLVGLAVSISEHSPVAYVETDYFGGTGSQSAIVWNKGRVVFGPVQTGAGRIVGAI